MARALLAEDRSDVGASAPIHRPRLVARLAASANYPIALIIAPAGYGKSVAIRQYVTTLDETVVTFSLRSEHATLLGFLRGFTQALGKNAPHASAALAGAYERNTVPKKRAGELAAWLHAHLESFSGLVVIDDLHIADGDPEIAQVVTSLIQRTKDKVRWILASRSTAGLPVGTWLAYRDAELPLDEHDLRFTVDETRAAARGLGLTTADEELDDLLALTEGWPAALSFALRTSIRSSELRSVSALTRDMIYRLLAEQIYAELDTEEQELLELASALPAIDIGVLERAGFDRALKIVEHLRERTSFIYEEAPGIYQCHDLFREFLRRQTALQGKRAQQIVQQRAARALEAGGDFEHGIAAFVAGGSPGDVVRLLEKYGFDLLERARGDVVSRALESIDERARRENATLLALQGALHAAAGKLSRAESFFRRALSRAGSDRDLIAVVSLRLASLMANQGQDIFALLERVAHDERQRPPFRAEALSMIAANKAISGEISTARAAVKTIEELLPEVDVELRRAKVLHCLGIVYRHTGDLQRAYARLNESCQLASALHFYGIASRAFGALANLALREEDDVAKQLTYAEAAADSAIKAGDACALEMALLQMLSAQMRNANDEEIMAIEHRLTLLENVNAAVYIRAFRAVRFGWERRFGEACELLSGCLQELPFSVDWVVSAAERALFLALDDQSEASLSGVRDVLSAVPRITVSGRFDVRSLAISQVLCAFAELCNGRATRSNRILQRLTMDDPVLRAIVHVVKRISWTLEGSHFAEWTEIKGEIAQLFALRYADLAKLLTASVNELRERRGDRDGAGTLTRTELEILRLLSRGLAPKEIAMETKRSVNTVRAHIASATVKLNCRGRAETVGVARQRGLI